MIGQSVGSDASRLSCFLFRPRKRLEKHRKALHKTPTQHAQSLTISAVIFILIVPFQSCFGHSPTNAAHSLSPPKAGTYLTIASKIAHSGSHAETGAFRTGPLSLPSTRTARLRTSPGRVSERQTLPLLGLGRVCSRRTQKAFGTAMRLCVSLSRGVAAPLGCVIFFAFVEIGICTSGAHGFPRVRGEGWYHYPRCALCAVEMPDGRLSKRLICRFLRSGGRSSPHDSYFLANTQNFLLAVPVANAFALWYDKFSKLEFSEAFLSNLFAKCFLSIPGLFLLHHLL